ncbi:uncharacterized protein LDX57_009128 [Aspergillus melleus]|uniref:uncharacterized protein n=1 Tax=Aspergillus melleus TaxID=138277 RepID=UPI001E8D4FF8|nr:uncharacterized protein LDX57_009128 [Aspergillus melleus]KAH8431465.1 hypothetical protein LDX57_009128 [Aspergillus melleus]
MTMNSTSGTRRKLPCGAYTVGWLCVLDYEIDVATVCLDEEHVTPSTPPDGNAYTAGRIGEHNVIIVKFTQSGTTSAATAVTNLLRTFGKIRFGLMVGIGGGAADNPESDDPTRETTDILLGDVVVSRPRAGHGGILQYDRGRREPGGFTALAHLNSPGDLLISAVDKLSRDHRSRRGKMAQYIEEGQSELRALGMNYFEFPGRDHDLLFASEYHHSTDERTCRGCDRNQMIVRTSEPRNNPVVHHGLIGSGNTLLRDAHMRDTLRREDNVLCFEMEAAGLMNYFPCLAIRGISDYADTHKNDLWQPYAALTAAAYAKDLLALIQPREIVGIDIASKLIPEARQTNKRLDIEYRSKILKWLTPLDFSGEQQRLYENSVPTGEWLLGSDVFSSWVNRASWQLRCHGGAGAGKTYLCALVVHHLQQTQPRSPVIYIYLSDQEQDRGVQTPVNLLGSLVKQLLLFKPSTENPCEIPPRLRDAYGSHPLSETILKYAFEELLSRHNWTYLIVDGFYQCSSDAVEVLEAYPLDLIRKGYKLSLLTTSTSDRGASGNIKCEKCGSDRLSIFLNCPCNSKDFDLCLSCKRAGVTCPNSHKGEVTNETAHVEVQAGPNELELLCHQKLRQASTPDPRKYDAPEYSDRLWKPSKAAQFLEQNPQLIQSIAEAITQQAKKNFLAAQARIAWLLEDSEPQPENGEELLSHLDKIPLSRLEPYVTRKKERIKRRELTREKLGFDTFSLIMTTRQPLTILALQHALARANLGVIREDNLEDRLSILKATNWLITIEKPEAKHAYVHFFHGTLVETFGECVQENPLGSAESKIASVCLKYLNDPGFATHFAEEHTYPFTPYVLEHWGDRVRSACLNLNPESDKIKSAAMDFLTTEGNIEMIGKCVKALKRRISLSGWVHKGIDVLRLCAWFGLRDIIPKLREKGHNIQVIESARHLTPLYYACARDRMDTVRLLALGPPANREIIAVLTGIQRTDWSYDELDERMTIISMLLRKRNLTLNSILRSRNANG